MAVNLSPLGGVGAQFFNNDGVPLSGGLIYTYLAGTNTPASVYTTSVGNVAHSNPIVLDSTGRVPTGEIWLTNYTSYKFVLKDSASNLIGTYDNIGSIANNQSASQISFTGFKGQTGNVQNLAGNDGSDWIGFLQSGVGAVAISAQDKMRQMVSVLDFGAVGDGVTNDYTAWSNAVAYCAANNKVLYAPATGNYYNIGSNLYINCLFDAGAYHVFGGTGTITFDSTKTVVGYAEWWGATTGGANCGPAINKAIKALLKVQLLAGDYFTNETIVMNLPHRTLIGVGSYYDDLSNQVTRVILNSATLDAIIVGPDVQPANINDFQKQNVVQDLFVERNARPDIAAAPNQILVRWTLSTELTNVRLRNGIYGFHFYGTVSCFATNCYSSRDVAGSGVGTDKWWGYYIDGQANIGAAGGNASLYLNYCGAACNIASLQTGLSVGFYANFAFTDCFMESPETVNCNIGIQVYGNASGTLTASNTDMQIKSPIVDQYHSIGIFVKDVNKFGSVSIENGYAGGATDSTQAVLVSNCPGSVRILGGQYVLVGATNSDGIAADNSNGLYIDGPQILECSKNPVTITGTSNCYIAPLVKNFQNTADTVVQFGGNCNRNIVQPVYYGGSPGAASLGIQLVGTTNGYNQFDCTGLDPTTIAGGSANKLVINGVQITTTGLTGTNLVAGVMN